MKQLLLRCYDGPFEKLLNCCYSKYFLAVSEKNSIAQGHAMFLPSYSYYVHERRQFMLKFQSRNDA